MGVGARGDLVFEPLVGESIDRVAFTMASIARTTGRSVRVTFNGVEMVLPAFGPAQHIIEVYQYHLQKRQETRMDRTTTLNGVVATETELRLALARIEDAGRERHGDVVEYSSIGANLLLDPEKVREALKKADAAGNHFITVSVEYGKVVVNFTPKKTSAKLQGQLKGFLWEAR